MALPPKTDAHTIETAQVNSTENAGSIPRMTRFHKGGGYSLSETSDGLCLELSGKTYALGKTDNDKAFSLPESLQEECVYIAHWAARSGATFDDIVDLFGTNAHSRAYEKATERERKHRTGIYVQKRRPNDKLSYGVICYGKPATRESLQRRAGTHLSNRTAPDDAWTGCCGDAASIVALIERAIASNTRVGLLVHDASMSREWGYPRFEGISQANLLRWCVYWASCANSREKPAATREDELLVAKRVYDWFCSSDVSRLELLDETSETMRRLSGVLCAVPMFVQDGTVSRYQVAVPGDSLAIRKTFDALDKLENDIQNCSEISPVARQELEDAAISESVTLQALPTIRRMLAENGVTLECPQNPGQEYGLLFDAVKRLRAANVAKTTPSANAMKQAREAEQAAMDVANAAEKASQKLYPTVIRDIVSSVNSSVSFVQAERISKVNQEANRVSKTKDTESSAVAESKTQKQVRKFKKSGKEALFRAGVKNAALLVKAPIVGLLSSGIAPGDESLRAKLAAFMDTELGTALAMGVACMLLELSPIQNDKTETISDELRTKCLEIGADKLMLMFAAPLEGLIKIAAASALEPAEEVRVATVAAETDDSEENETLASELEKLRAQS